MGCSNSIVVDAPVEHVWGLLRDFHDFSWAAGVIEQCEAVGEVGPTTPGAKRVLNGVFHETLLALDDHERLVRYSIDRGPPPLEGAAGYVGVIQVFPVTTSGQTFVRWSSSWATGDTAELRAFCNPIYHALLAALQAHVAG